MQETESTALPRTTKQIRHDAFTLFRKNLRLFVPIVLLLAAFEYLVPALLLTLSFLLGLSQQNFMISFYAWHLLLFPISVVGLWGVCYALSQGEKPRFSRLFAFCRKPKLFFRTLLAGFCYYGILFSTFFVLLVVILLVASGFVSIGGPLELFMVLPLLLVVYYFWFEARTRLIPHLFVTGQEQRSFASFRTSFARTRGYAKRLALFEIRTVILWGLLIVLVCSAVEYLLEYRIFLSDLSESCILFLFRSFPYILLSPYFFLAQVGYVETLFPPKVPEATPELTEAAPEAASAEAPATAPEATEPARETATEIPPEAAPEATSPDLL